MKSMNCPSERRNKERIVAFCQVLDLEHNFLGVTFDLSREGICLSLPATFSSSSDFFVILSPTYTEHLLEVIVKIQPTWRKQNHSLYDEIGGKILQIWPEESFEVLLSHYQKNGPGGLDFRAE